MTVVPNSSGQSYLQPGDVIYAPDWNYCYEILSGPFCRIHYVSWQGRLASTPGDSRFHVSYLIRALGGKTVHRLIVRTADVHPSVR